MNAQKTPAGTTGGDIDAYCGKCRLTLAHVVMATDGTRVVRVQCKTCRSEHAMRRTAPKAGTKAAGGATKAPRASRAAAKPPAERRAERRAEAAFEAARAGKDLSEATRYVTTHVFASGEVVDHPTFGLGVVEKCLSDRKVQVIFQKSGERLLVHSR